MRSIGRLFSFIFAFSLVISASAQDSAIGYWESHLPYNNGVGVATDGNTLFTACAQGFFTFNLATDSKPVPYSKVEGMSDIGMKCVGYDAATSTAVLVYADGNIDLFRNNFFYNMADLKTKSISGVKDVYGIYTENGIAYLSTTLGILVIDLTKHIVLETYKLVDTAAGNQTIPVTCFTGSGPYFYAGTPGGLFRINKNNPRVEDFHEWKQLNTTPITNIANLDNSLFLSNQQSLYMLKADTLDPIYTTSSYYLITHLDAGSTSVYISEYNDTTFKGNVKTVNSDGVLTDSTNWSGKPVQVTERLDKSIWVADAYFGLERLYQNTPYVYIPAGPPDPSSFDIYANNKAVYIAHGGFSSTYHINNNSRGISILKDGKWSAYDGGLYPALNSMQDFDVILKDESKNTFYAGSFYNGLFTINADGTTGVTGIPTFDESQAYFGHPQVVGLGEDKSGNIWASTFASSHQLYGKNATDGKWYKFTIPGLANGGPLVVDDNNQVWFVSLPDSKSGGVGVYNYGTSVSDPSDDAYYALVKGPGAGNLPSNTVFCIAKDNNNAIWIGTDNGIGIVSGCSAPFNRSTAPCDAELPIVQYDKYAGYLFAGNGVRTIAVDGGNRKWVGTDDGVWLLSPDASKIIYRFTTDNSPLPSDHIQKISIDKVTGDVYIGTEMGLMCYRSTGTGGGESNSNVQIFPNPVHHAYTGPIAIKGLVTNADVRITDVAGQLVYHTTAYGGQAVWNGLDYLGRRPQSGIYLIFASNSDGSQTYSGKIAFVQ